MKRNERCYFVTGGAGFIGSHIVDALCKDEGNLVVVIDNFHSGHRRNLLAALNRPNVLLMEGDFRTSDAIDRELDEEEAERRKNRQSFHREEERKKYKSLDLGAILAEYDVSTVFHVGAIPGVQYSIPRPRTTHSVNVLGTQNLLEACARIGREIRFVFSSSSSIYGEVSRFPTPEDIEPKRPVSPYAQQKLDAEDLCMDFNRRSNVKTIALRYFNVFGPRQNPEGPYSPVIAKFTLYTTIDQPPKINGDGLQTRDFTYVENVVQANLNASQTKNPECFGQAFNIGSGKRRSILDVAGRINELYVERGGRYLNPQHGAPVVEARDSEADIAKARALLGWTPTVPFDEGLRRTFEHIWSYRRSC